MTLKDLDQRVPKRWILLLRSWLPFFKKPAPFYIILRRFIQREKKHTKAHQFNLETLPELLFLMSQHSQVDPDKKLEKLAYNLLDKLTPDQFSLISIDLFQNILNHFQFIKNNTLLIYFLEKLPSDVFTIYANSLDIAEVLSISESNNDDQPNTRFYLRTRTNNLQPSTVLRRLFASSDTSIILPNAFKICQFLCDHQEDLHALICSGDLTLNEQCLLFILRWEDHLHLPNYQLCRLYSTLCGVDFFKTHISIKSTTAQVAFLNKLFLPSTDEQLLQKNQELLGRIVRNYPQEDRVDFVEQLLQDYWTNPNRMNVFALNSILENLEDFRNSLPPFQICILSSLDKTEKAIDIRTLEAICALNFLELRKLTSYSQKVQLSNINSVVKSLKTYMHEVVIPRFPNKPERNSLHTLWRGFYNSDSPLTLTPSQQIEKIETIIKIRQQAIADPGQDAQVVCCALKKFLSLLEEPPLSDCILREEDKQAKLRRYTAQNEEKIRALKQQAWAGELSQVSVEHIRELCNGEGKQIQQLAKYLEQQGAMLFHSADPAEHKQALLQANQLKQYTHDACRP